MRTARGILPALLLGALTAAAAPHGGKTPRGGNAVPAATAFVRADDAAKQHGFAPARNSGGTLFVSGKSTLRFTPEKPVCLVDGVKVYQCFPSRRSSAGVLLTRLDAQKTVGPLSPRRSGVFRHRVRTITIDPGHGGRDRGAAGRYIIEKTATLLLAHRVMTILRACGYRVHLTRSGDYYVPLAERCRIQRRHKSDLFVSIHFNAAEKKDFHGIETFALTPAGAASTSGGPPVNKRFFGNYFDANNLLLAHTIQRTLLRRTGAFDRGVKRARWAVLKDIDAPGVLVEVGFVSNPREERRMLDPVYREKLARGIAEGIIVYHRIMLGR